MTHISEEIVSAGLFIIKSSDRKTGVGKTLYEATKIHKSGKIQVSNNMERSIAACLKNGHIRDFDVTCYSVVARKERLRFAMCPDVKCDRYNTSDLPELVKYDVKYHLVERPVFLDQYLCPAVATTFIARRNDVIVGYGSTQPVRDNTYHLGPLFADSDDVAELLLKKIFDAVPSDMVIDLYVPEGNNKTRDLLKKHDIRDIENFAHMYEKERIIFSFDNIYAMTETDASLI